LWVWNLGRWYWKIICSNDWGIVLTCLNFSVTIQKVTNIFYWNSKKKNCTRAGLQTRGLTLMRGGTEKSTRFHYAERTNPICILWTKHNMGLCGMSQPTLQSLRRSYIMGILLLSLSFINKVIHRNTKAPSFCTSTNFFLHPIIFWEDCFASFKKWLPDYSFEIILENLFHNTFYEFRIYQSEN